ncbi:MAG: efflux RND transporter periplasmic adaptor subunit [Acidobacteriaceae bacterium]|nr:efflux RND transporter periplasmic adaptor subunit [Acidobacteriaceae bacterium]
MSAPLEKTIRGQLQFLGQFSAVNDVELRAQVGGTLTRIGFKDGDIVKAGTLLFEIDPTQYEIKLANAAAQVERARTQVAKARTQVEMTHARFELASQELARAQTLQKTDAGSVENVQQRSEEQVSAKAAVDQAEASVKEAEASVHEAEAVLRDARYDVDHTRIYAPFTGRMGTHLVSVGNLVSGNRGGGNSTTLLATILSVDPIYLNFDMSEVDFLSFQRERTSRRSDLRNQVDISLSDENRFRRQGTLNFLDNTVDRSSGTIHARATVTNPDLLLTPGAFGRVRVNLSTEKHVLLIPDACVTADQADHAVLIVDATGAVEEKKVQVGDIRYGLRVVYSGLSTSDRVIVGGPPVAPGVKVSPTNSTIAAASDEGGY